jgi:predicted ATP-grasp superfamily ATP-dependent carboligase
MNPAPRNPNRNPQHDRGTGNPEPATTRLAIAGASARAAAESAARAGFEVASFDAYADLDQHPSVRAHAVGRNAHGRFSPHRAARAASAHSADVAVYLSSFENHPTAVSLLARGRTLWGNAPSVLQRVRDPLDVAQAFARRGFAVPAVMRASKHQPTHVGDTAVGRDATGKSWLVKPRRSGGGHGVRAWRPRSPIPAQAYLQARVHGVAGSIVFVADGRRAVPLGISRQLIGDAAFGAAGFQYCGSILAGMDVASVGSEEVFDVARALADAVAEEYAVIGLNGIDFIVSNGVPWPIEINPRWCASMELVERAHRLSMFGAHAAACARGELPAFDLPTSSRTSRTFGKAVVFARHRCRVRQSAILLEQTDIRDIPHPGEQIEEGRPICTVFAEADTEEDCYAALVVRADAIHQLAARWRTEAA